MQQQHGVAVAVGPDREADVPDFDALHQRSPGVAAATAGQACGGVMTPVPEMCGAVVPKSSWDNARISETAYPPG